MTAAIIPANTGRKGDLVEIDRTLPVEKPEQIGTALAGLSAALVHRQGSDLGDEQSDQFADRPAAKTWGCPMSATLEHRSWPS